MKKLIQTFAVLVSFLAISCSDDSDSKVTANQVDNTIQSGTWRITLFEEDGVDQTSNFAGYNFTFGDASAVVASNGTNSYNGIYSVTTSSSDDDSAGSDVDFNIFFIEPDNFTEISEDWDVISRSSNKITLRHVSGGDGSIDSLIFEKN